MKLFTALAIACLVTTNSFAQDANEVINIWPNTPPGAPNAEGPEQDMTKDTDPLIAGGRIIKLGNVSVPQMHVYLPAASKRTGAAMVICPGGGFTILAWDLEGTEIAQWLVNQGIVAIVLKYRVPTRTQDPSWLAPTQDAQRAISITRSRSADWMIEKGKVGILGFSAGGSTAAHATLSAQRLYEKVDRSDDENHLPNRAVLIYSAGLPEDSLDATLATNNITAQTPPVFMAHTFDDFVPVQGPLNMLLAMKKVGVASELHVFDAGGHGYGLRHRDDLPVTDWPKLCESWLRRADWMK
jgi:acetyl esterase/lipase